MPSVPLHRVNKMADCLRVGKHSAQRHCARWRAHYCDSGLTTRSMKWVGTLELAMYTGCPQHCQSAWNLNSYLITRRCPGCICTFFLRLSVEEMVLLDPESRRKCPGGFSEYIQQMSRSAPVLYRHSKLYCNPSYSFWRWSHVRE